MIVNVAVRPRILPVRHVGYSKARQLRLQVTDRTGLPQSLGQMLTCPCAVKRDTTAATIGEEAKGRRWYGNSDNKAHVPHPPPGRGVASCGHTPEPGRIPFAAPT